MSREDAFKYLKKIMPDAVPVPGEAPPPIEFISSGSIAVDYIAGGGFPRGKVSEVFGVESSGKTTLCMSACAQAQAAGLYPVYVDIERGLDPLFAEKIGFDFLDPQRGYYIKPRTFEEVLEIIETMSTTGEADLIVTDSIPAMVPESAFKEKITDMGQLGQVGRLFSISLPRLTKVIEKTRTAVVFTNQLRANIQTDWAARFAPKEKTAGGYALKYFSSLRLELRQQKKNAKVIEQTSLTDPTKKEELSVASRHSAMAFKNKVSQPYRSIEFFIRYDPVHNLWGIDDLQTMLDIAMVKDVIEAKGGGQFVYNAVPDAVKFKGESALYDYFAGKPERVGALRQTLGIV
jgi:recombination protein RecA